MIRRWGSIFWGITLFNCLSIWFRLDFDLFSTSNAKLSRTMGARCILIIATPPRRRPNVADALNVGWTQNIHWCDGFFHKTHYTFVLASRSSLVTEGLTLALCIHPLLLTLKKEIVFLDIRPSGLRRRTNSMSKAHSIIRFLGRQRIVRHGVKMASRGKRGVQDTGCCLYSTFSNLLERVESGVHLRG